MIRFCTGTRPAHPRIHFHPANRSPYSRTITNPMHKAGCDSRNETRDHNYSISRSSGGIHRICSQSEKPDPVGTGQSCGLREPGTGSPLLADRERDPGTAGAGRMGFKSHRPIIPGPDARIPCNEGILLKEPEIYAEICRSLA